MLSFLTFEIGFEEAQMNELLLIVAAVISLLLSIIYWAVRTHSQTKSQLRSAQNVKSLAGMAIPKALPLNKAIEKILSVMMETYNAQTGSIEVHSKKYGDFALSSNKRSGINKVAENSKLGFGTQVKFHPKFFYNAKKIQPVTFAVYDESFTCRVELETSIIPTHDEYWHIQELMREKFSLLFSAEASQLTAASRGSETTDSQLDRAEALLMTVMAEFNFGVAIFSKNGGPDEGEFKIESINDSFYRIFGLDGSNAQPDEVNEILSTAIKLDEMRKLMVGTCRIRNDFVYMRHDGLKVRAKVIFLKDQDSFIIIFEPLEDLQLLKDSYGRLLVASEHLFKSGDLRAFLKAIHEGTRSDGVALAKYKSDTSLLEIVEKVGFVINLPQLIVSKSASTESVTSAREFISSQGYILVPIYEDGTITSILAVLKPAEDTVRVAIMGAKILEAFSGLQKEIHNLHLECARLETEAKRADLANNSKSEFLANMSHEIRTPLNSIIGFADIIHSEARELSPELLSEFSGNIVTAGEHLLSLINDILDLTKVETGMMKLDLQEFSLNEVVRGVERTLRPLSDKKKINIDINIEDSLDTFTADLVKFKQILYNLLSNTIKHSKTANCVKLEIMRSTNGIEIKIIDNGIGIKKEDLDKLFKPFSQIGSTAGGTGLGLSLTKKLVELHGGTIWIESVYGSGTKVVVYLPDHGQVSIREESNFPNTAKAVGNPLSN
jgi:signal transduction histidine kinase